MSSPTSGRTSAWARLAQCAAGMARRASLPANVEPESMLGAGLGIALRLTLLVWVAHFLVSTAQGFLADAPHTVYAAHLGFQTLLIGMAFFLYAVMGVDSSRIHWVLGAQLVSGLLAIWWNHAGADPAARVSSAWLTLSLLSAVLFCMAAAAHIYLPRSGPGWLALLVSTAGLAVCIDGGRLDTGDALAPAWRDHFQALLVLLVWQAVTLLAAPPQGPELAHDYLRIGGTGHEQLTASSAVALERRRIAQDLHDGVASQLVGILSSLDHDMPQQQALGLALEQCLLDIKMTVDGIDCADQNVLEVLGSLRYRVRRPMDRLGITLVWDIEICSALENIRGQASQQVLRIAQECLSNVMRHAQASVVTVVCRYVAEAGCMEFAVSDNGVGIPPVIDADAGGRGLDNMRRRAHAIGGDLGISRTTSGGTCVRLTLPLEPEFCMLLGAQGDARTDSGQTASGIPAALRPALHAGATVPPA